MQIRLSQHRPIARVTLGRWRNLLTLALVVALLVVALAIWPSAHLAVSAYEVLGFATLLAFMSFVLALATVLGVMAVKVLAGDET
jgi:hypothetical protein